MKILYRSTNRSSELVDFKKAVLKGQAPDYGLYIPAQIPVLNKKEIENLRGLLRTENTKRGNKVPVLGDIFPFLFKNKSETGKKTDLVIFLTPKIITEKEAKEIAEKEKTRFEEKK
jgi:threonine synthase